MQIDFYQSQQCETVADLLHDMSVHYNGVGASTRQAVLNNLKHNILGPDSGVRLVVATADDQAVGLACISLLYPAPKEQAQLFMKELYVLSSHRGRGIADAIMRWLAQYAVEKHCLRFDWTVDADNQKALDFYDALGAKRVSEKYYYRLSGEALHDLANSDGFSAKADR